MMMVLSGTSTTPCSKLWSERGGESSEMDDDAEVTTLLYKIDREMIVTAFRLSYCLPVSLSLPLSPLFLPASLFLSPPLYISLFPSLSPPPYLSLSSPLISLPFSLSRLCPPLSLPLSFPLSSSFSSVPTSTHISSKIIGTLSSTPANSAAAADDGKIIKLMLHSSRRQQAMVLVLFINSAAGGKRLVQHSLIHQYLILPYFLLHSVQLS